jgi:hypothetical protein
MLAQVSPWSKRGRCAESPLPGLPLTTTWSLVARLLVRPILLHRASAKPHLAHANPHGGVSGLRTHREGNARTPRLVRHHALHLCVKPVLAARPRARGGARGTARAELRPACRAGRACAGERRAVRTRTWRRRDAARRRCGISAQNEEARRPREYFARHARRLGCASAGAARRVDMGRRTGRCRG